MQPESAMRGGAGEIEARAEGDVVVRACAGGTLGGGLVNRCRGVGVAVDKRFNGGSVTGRIRPRRRAREGRRLDRRRGKFKAVRV